MYHVLLLCTLMLFLSACSGKKESKNAKQDSAKSDNQVTQAVKTQPAQKKTSTTKKSDSDPLSKYTKPSNASDIQDDGKVVTIKLGSTDQMKYTFSRIDVAANRKIKLTLTHLGKLPGNVMGHNFVLLKQGEDFMAFANSGMAAKDTDHIAPGNESKVIAKTRLIGGGESDTIEFDAPPPGIYPFVCTKPGHAMMMNGVLVVK